MKKDNPAQVSHWNILICKPICKSVAITKLLFKKGLNDMIKENKQKGEDKTTHEQVPKLQVSLQTSLLAEERKREWKHLMCLNADMAHFN